MKRILLCDDEVKLSRVLQTALTSAGYTVECVTTGRAALARCAEQTFEVVLTDLRLPDIDGLAVTQALRKDPGGPEVIVMTAYATAETAVQAMRLGAYDYLIKPFSIDELRIRVARLMSRRALQEENGQLQHQLSTLQRTESLIGTSARMREVFELISQVAATDATVMLLGESGTGKTALARALHAQSRRRGGPLCELHCAALPESLLESELFGHERGAFTGATAEHTGHVQQAHKGSLFLDEIGELPMSIQIKLLLEAAHVAQPRDLAVLLLLGVTCARLGYTERAEPMLRTVALHADPEDQAAARIFLSIIYRDQGATDRAQQELNKAAAQAPSLGSSVHGLLQGLQPNLISGSVIIASEFDGNVPLTSLPNWRAAPSSSSDGDFLFIGVLTVRPSRRIGLYLSDTISYRQQLQLQDYNLFLNTITLGYGYFGVQHRVRLAAAFTPALLGGQLLYLDAAWRAAYRVKIVQKLGVAISYDGRYRDYWRPEYDAFSGSSHTAQAELSWGVLPDPVSAGIGFQVVLDALAERPPSAGPDGCLISDDFRAWAVGPTVRLRVRLHRRVELALLAAILRRRFDYVLPSGERRFDWEVSADLSLNVEATRWLDVFVGSLHTRNGSTDDNYSYYKPNIYLGVYGHFAAY